MYSDEIAYLKFMYIAVPTRARPVCLSPRHSPSPAHPFTAPMPAANPRKRAASSSAAAALPPGTAPAAHRQKSAASSNPRPAIADDAAAEDDEEETTAIKIFDTDERITATLEQLRADRELK